MFFKLCSGAAGRSGLALLALSLSCELGCKRGEHSPLTAGWLELCSGFAAPTGGLLIGRIHQGTPPAAPQPGETPARRIHETLQALDAHPLADVPLSASIGGRQFKGVRSNDRGYIDIAPLPGFTPPSVRIRLEVEDPKYQVSALEADLPVYDNDPGLAIITDIDDTLLATGVTDKLKMAEQAVTRSTWELEMFPGAPEVLRRLAGVQPVFYVSGSPWGFRDRLTGFFARKGFPPGPLLLKRFSSDPMLDQMAYKWQHIASVVDALPAKRWLLFGDSGEKDPEIYARLAQERPGRVEAIYIHLVTPEEPAAPRFAGMRVFRDWTELAPSTAAATAPTPAVPAAPIAPATAPSAPAASTQPAAPPPR